MTGTHNDDDPWYVKDIRPKKAKVVEDTSVAPHIHDNHRPSLLSRGAASDNGGTGKGHVAGRIGTRQLGVAVTPDSAKAGKPIATGIVRQGGKLDVRQAKALSPRPDVRHDADGKPLNGESAADQANRLRAHSRRLVRAIARARNDEHREALNEMLDRNYRRLRALQEEHLAKHEAGEKSPFDPLQIVPKSPTYLLPRGSVPRGFNSKGR